MHNLNSLSCRTGGIKLTAAASPRDGRCIPTAERKAVLPSAGGLPPPFAEVGDRSIVPTGSSPILVTGFLFFIRFFAL
jgi:hypothetical protein